MTLLEGTVLLLLLLLSLPGLCNRYRRPGLLYPAYIVAGAIAGAFMAEPVQRTWREVGELGFILLLFSVGLEIELPERRESFIALRRALAWMLPQVVLVTAGLLLLHVPLLEAIAAAVAISSSSVGMGFILWKHHPFPDAVSRKAFLEWMVAIEVVSIIALASLAPVLEGEVWWLALLRFAGLLVAAALAAFIALRIVPRVSQFLRKGVEIDVPLLVLILFTICALGARLGLSAPKMAFVLGLFISRSTDEEVALNHRLAPLRDRMFVPVFYFGLGTLLHIGLVKTLPFYAAVAAGVLLFHARGLLFRVAFARRFSTRASAHVVAAPMLTIGAVAVEILAKAKASPNIVAWTLTASLSLTLCAAFNSSSAQRLVDLEPSMAAPEAVALLEEDRKE